MNNTNIFFKILFKMLIFFFCTILLIGYLAYETDKAHFGEYYIDDEYEMWKIYAGESSIEHNELGTLVDGDFESLAITDNQIFVKFKNQYRLHIEVIDRATSQVSVINSQNVIDLDYSDLKFIPISDLYPETSGDL